MEVIICNRMDDYVYNKVKEEKFKGVCKECHHKIIYGGLALKQVRDKNNLLFLCKHCYLKQPESIKLVRPSQDMIESLRKQGYNLDLHKGVM